MAVAIVTGSGGLVGSQTVERFVRGGLPRGRAGERHAGRLLRPQRLDAAGHRAARAASWPSSLRSRSTSATLTRSSACSPTTAARSSWSFTRPRSRPTTGPRRTRRPTSRVNANGTLNLLEATRRHAEDGAVHLPVHQQGLRRPAQRAAARGARDAPRAARGPPLVRRHRRVDEHRRLDALAVRRVQGRGRPARAGVRPLLRDADGVLPRRLPDRAQPRRRDAARLPRPT